MWVWSKTTLQPLDRIQQLLRGKAASANLDLGNMQLKVQIWSHVTFLLLFRVHNCPGYIRLQVQDMLAVRQESDDTMNHPSYAKVVTSAVAAILPTPWVCLLMYCMLSIQIDVVKMTEISDP